MEKQFSDFNEYKKKYMIEPFYEHTYRGTAERVVERLIDGEILSYSDVLKECDGTLLFSKNIIEAYFALISRKVLDRGMVLVSYPVIEPSNNLDITVLDFKFRAVEPIVSPIVNMEKRYDINI